jgi:hypothetical protein
MWLSLLKRSSALLTYHCYRFPLGCCHCDVATNLHKVGTHRRTRPLGATFKQRCQNVAVVELPVTRSVGCIPYPYALFTEQINNRFKDPYHEAISAALNEEPVKVVVGGNKRFDIIPNRIARAAISW